MVVVGIPGFNKQIFVVTSQFPGYSKHLWLAPGCSLYPSLTVHWGPSIRTTYNEVGSLIRTKKVRISESVKIMSHGYGYGYRNPSIYL